MSRTSKSPNAVAAEALAVARRVLQPYSHKYSPKTYTQHQLFAALVLKTFFKTDYRGIVQILADSSDLRQILGLAKLPHYTTLQKACVRLMGQRPFRRLLHGTIRRHYGRRRRVARAAADSSGLDLGHASRYYVRRRSRDGTDAKRMRYRRFAKLELVVDCAEHLILAALTGRGPAVDVDRFVPLVQEAQRYVRLSTVLADAGYDSEPNHRWARQSQGLRSVMPATLGRPSTKPPAGRYRRLMRQRLTKDYCQFGQRWQAETVISMIKRRQGDSVAGHSAWSQRRELRLMALTHNIMILYVPAGFLQSIPDPVLVNRDLWHADVTLTYLVYDPAPAVSSGVRP